MNIFDPLITGSLSVSGSGEISGDLTVLGTINATISGTTSNALTASEAPRYTLTSSFETFTSSIVSKTGSYATTGSNLFKGTQTHSGSIIPSVDNTYDLGSPDYQWRDVYISSGSLYIDGTKVLSSTAQELTITTDNGQSLKILEGTTDSIVLQVADGDIELKSSADGDILLDPTNGKIMLKGPVEILNGQKIQSSVNGTPVVFANDIVVSGSIELTGTIDGIDLSSLSSSLNTRIGSIETTTTSLNSFTSSASGRLDAIETSTSSLNGFTSSINTTIKSKLDTEGVVSGSSQIILSGTTGFSTVSASLSSLSSSISITNFNQDGRLTSIEGKTGSFATTGSNNFIGDQTITGSLVITQNLQVLGSSSFLYVTSSQLNVSSSTISVNIFEPAERFGGLKVYDSGSSSATASLLWDSLNNRFVYQNVDGASYNGAVLIGGPRNSGSLGDEPLLTSGKIPKSVGGDHIDNSIMSEVGGNAIAISGGLVITGSILSTVTPLVSGSSQITYSGLSDIPSGIISGSSQVISSLPSGTVSGSSQVLNGSGVWSGSAQLPSGIISGSAQLPSGTVSGSSQVLNGSGIWSGSAQLPGGVVSGSSQIDLIATTNYSSGIKTRLNAEGVVSGSSQITLSSTTGYGSVINQALLTTSDITHNSAVIGNMNISKTPYTDTIENKTSGGVVWLNYGHNGNVGLVYGGGNVGVGTISSLSSKFTVYKGSQSNTVSVANSAAFIYGADIGLAIGQDSGTAGYGTWLQSMQTGGNSFPMTINPNGGSVIVGSLTTSSYKFSVFGGQYGTYLRGGDLGTGSDILRLVDSAGTTKYLARGDGKHYFEGDTAVNGGDLKFNPGTGNIGNRYLTLNKGASNDGGILMQRDNSNDWQIINKTTSGDLSFYSYGTGTNPLVISRSSGVITADNGFNIGSTKLRWGGNTTPTLGFPFTAAANAFWIDVNDGDTGGIVVDNDGTTIYGAGDAGYVFRVIDEDVYQGNSNVTSSTTFQINQGVNGGGYVRGAFEVTGNLTTAGLTSNGIGVFNSTNDTQISLRSTDAWAGIEFDDSGTADYIWYNGGNQTFSIGGGGGNVSGKKLHVHGGMTIGSSYTATSNPTNGLNVQGDTTIGGTLTENSSLRYKKDIVTIEGGLDKVMRMRGVTYLKKETNIKEVGVIAEEINEILPDLVKYNTEGQIDSVSYSRITAVLIEAIKELKQEINELKNNG
jgi:hypothetical protein